MADKESFIDFLSCQISINIIWLIALDNAIATIKRPRSKALSVQYLERVYSAHQKGKSLHHPGY